MELRDAFFRVDEQPAHIERIHGDNHGIHPSFRSMVLFMTWMCTVVRVLFVRRESELVAVSCNYCMYLVKHTRMQGMLVDRV